MSDGKTAKLLDEMHENNLESIGFYSLRDERAFTSTHNTRLERCEMILTDRCNFKCSYCRGVEQKGDIDFDEAKKIIKIWTDNELRNIRFSGGEPTLYPRLIELVTYTRSFDCIEHIAISTNSTADLNYYEELIDCGVNDFSISLDACCGLDADTLAGTDSRFEKIKNNIRELSKKTYVSVGIVITPENIQKFDKIVFFANSLGVSDIRIISSAQYNTLKTFDIPKKILENNPILNYRYNNLKKGKDVRGLKKDDTTKCGLSLDDMVIVKGYHYPCVIYMREQGESIGKVNEDVRVVRKKWYESHNTHNDEICRKNCLDVCVDYNNKHHLAKS